MVGIRKTAVFFLLAPALLSCGKEGDSAPTAVRGAVVGVLAVPPSLQASRLLNAGCMQLVRPAAGPLTVEFSATACPSPASTLQTSASVVFSLAAEEQEKNTRLVLRKDGVPVGEAAGNPDDTTGVRVWNLEHLCQVSDPQVKPDRYFAEVCRLDFETEGEKVGRYRALKMASLEELARGKILEIDGLVRKEERGMRQLSGLERERETNRRQLERASLDRQEALEALAEAQRGVRDSAASNVTVHRTLERVKIEAELEYASRDAKYYELSAQLANLERDRAEMLRKRLEEADRAKALEESLAKKLEHYKQLGMADSDEFKILQGVFDDNHGQLVSKDDRRKLEQAMALSMANAKEIEKLTEKARVAYSVVIEKRDELNKLNRISPIPATED